MSGDQWWQCPDCDTPNPSDVARCVQCGRGRNVAREVHQTSSGESRSTPWGFITFIYGSFGIVLFGALFEFLFILGLLLPLLIAYLAIGLLLLRFAPAVFERRAAVMTDSPDRSRWVLRGSVIAAVSGLAQVASFAPAVRPHADVVVGFATPVCFAAAIAVLISGGQYLRTQPTQADGRKTARRRQAVRNGMMLAGYALIASFITNVVYWNGWLQHALGG